MMFGRKRKQLIYQQQEYKQFVSLTKMMASSINKISVLLKRSDIKELIDSGRALNGFIKETAVNNNALMQETIFLVELINRDYVTNMFVPPSVGLILQTNINKFKSMVNDASQNFSIISSLIKIDKYASEFINSNNDDGNPRLVLDQEKLINILYTYLMAIVSAQLMMIDIGSIVFYEINKIDSDFDYITDYQNHKNDKFKSEHDEMSYKVTFMRNIDNRKEENKNAK